MSRGSHLCRVPRRQSEGWQTGRLRLRESRGNLLLEDSWCESWVRQVVGNEGGVRRCSELDERYQLEDLIISYDEGIL